MATQLTAAKNKIKDLDELAWIVGELKKSGRRVVHCHGVFDLIHIGHMRHFEGARRHGDVLIVTLTPDQWVNKGPHRPAFSEELRAEMVAALQCVDYVALNRWPTAVETIRLLQPNFFAKGSEYRNAGEDITGAIQKEEEAVNSVGGKLVYTEDVVFSSSTLLNRHMPLISKEASDFLAGFAVRHPVKEVLSYLEGARKLKVLVIGETILDEYHYCQTLGKSGKEPILAVRQLATEKFAGGVLAVANHVASFSERVRLFTFLGQEDTQEDFIRARLSPAVTPSFFYLPEAPTIVKRRFIERYPFQKMFEVYLLNEDSHDPEQAGPFRSALAEALPEFDLVIVTDYGHGMLDAATVDVLCKRSRCLAVNTQANAANHGFNTISKYPRADYISVSESEIRLEARQRRQDLYQIVADVGARLGCRKVMVTRGQQGILCHDRKEGFFQAPALVGHFTDRVGAGDAVFAVTSLCMAQGAPAEVLAVIGNAVGAMAVGVVGNRSAIDRTALGKSLISFCK